MPGPEWWGPLIASGPTGVVLIWFMLRMERHVKESTMAADRMTRAAMILVITSRHGSEGEKVAAEDLLEEVHRAGHLKDMPLHHGPR